MEVEVAAAAGRRRRRYIRLWSEELLRFGTLDAAIDAAHILEEVGEINFDVSPPPPSANNSDCSNGNTNSICTRFLFQFTTNNAIYQETIKRFYNQNGEKWESRQNWGTWANRNKSWLYFSWDYTLGKDKSQLPLVCLYPRYNLITANKTILECPRRNSVLSWILWCILLLYLPLFG